MTTLSKIMTQSGRLVAPAGPAPEDLSIKDIAYSLAGINRFTGHARPRYNVAEHSVYVSAYAQLMKRGHSVIAALWGLLHDASEAYMSDISRPLKQHPQLEGYRVLEAGVQGIVQYRFLPRLCTAEENALVHEADAALCVLELEELLPPSTVTLLSCWSPEEAELRFLKRYYELCAALQKDYPDWKAVME
jgi:hypothetical protein